MPRIPYLIAIILVGFLLINSVYVAATGNDLTLYGNEPQFANNILLTIDDASIEANVRIMFDLLREHGLTATFFPNMRYLQHQDPQLWQEIIEAGFEIGYHTRQHTAYMTVAELTADFNQFQAEMRLLLNNPTYTVRYVRPPDGAWDSHWLTWANANNLFTVRWNITNVTDDMLYIEAVLRNRSTGGSIILLHTSDYDVRWLQSNLPHLIALKDNQHNAYRIVNLSDALAD